MDEFILAVPATISKIDSKGRVSIPMPVRARLKLLEGSEVRLSVRDGCIYILPLDGRNSTMASAGDCGSPCPGSSPGSGPLKSLRGGKK